MYLIRVYYPKNIKSFNSTTKNSFKEWEKDLSKHCRCSTLLFIREKEIKPQWDTTEHLLGQLLWKRGWEGRRKGKQVRMWTHWTLVYCCCWVFKICSHWDTCLGVPHNRMTNDSISRVIPKKTENRDSYFFTNVNSSINHNRQKVKTHRCSTSEWITCIYTHIYLHKKYTHPQTHTQWNEHYGVIKM